MDGTFALTAPARRGRALQRRRSLVSGGNPSVARCGDAQLASARSSVCRGTSIASASAAARRSRWIGSPIANSRLAASVQRSLAESPRDARQVQGVGLQLIQAQAAERDEQVIAAHPPEAGQREPLEQPLEAPLGAPPGVAGERRPPGSPPSCGRRAACRSRARDRGRCAGRAGCRRRSDGCSAGPAARRMPTKGSSPSSGHPRLGAAGARRRDVQGKVGDQKAHPRGLGQVVLGERPRLGIEAHGLRARASSRPAAKAISSTRRAASAEARRPGRSAER